MPNLTFVLPHWLYWAGILFFPLIAGYLATREEKRGPVIGQATRPIAYLLLVTAGFIGLHRFYLRAPRLAPLYIILFVLVLYGNIQGRHARVDVSNAYNQLSILQFEMEGVQAKVKESQAGAVENLARMQERLKSVEATRDAADQKWNRWELFSGGFALLILLGLLLDAYLLPGMVRKCQAEEVAKHVKIEDITHEVPTLADDPTLRVHSPYTDWIDKISGWNGNFVCYWSIMAVFVYYYEVIARYVFNSPTNWAHEGMFLMFGMQYLLSGAFALREDSHVRVDVIYLYFPDRVKAMVDLGTSIFFFIFTLTFMVTGAIFAWDSISVLEVSFTEWAIQFWPVKLSIVVGTAMLTLQGVSKVIKDFVILAEKEA